MLRTNVVNGIDSTINRLLDIQGGCERIKNTVFPNAVTQITRLLVWGLVALLMAALAAPVLAATGEGEVEEAVRGEVPGAVAAAPGAGLLPGHATAQ